MHGVNADKALTKLNATLISKGERTNPAPLRFGDNSTSKLQCTLFLKLGSH